MIFTYVFAVYSFYFFHTWLSIIPSIVLHCYCNFLGPPSIHKGKPPLTKDNLHFHVICIAGAIFYCYNFVSQ